MARLDGAINNEASLGNRTVPDIVVALAGSFKVTACFGQNLFQLWRQRLCHRLSDLNGLLSMGD